MPKLFSDRVTKEDVKELSALAVVVNPTQTR